MSTYRSGYSTNHVLIVLIENWRYALDDNLFTDALVMDLSKAFYCIFHYRVIAKLHAYSLECDTVTFLHNYLKHQKQSGNANNISSFFRTRPLGVPEGSILQWFSWYFEALWCLTKFTFHHKWNEAWLLVINMAHTSCLTSCRTT